MKLKFLTLTAALGLTVAALSGCATGGGANPNLPTGGATSTGGKPDAAFNKPIFKKQFAKIKQLVDSNADITPADFFYLIRNFKSATINPTSAAVAADKSAATAAAKNAAALAILSGAKQYATQQGIAQSNSCTEQNLPAYMCAKKSVQAHYIPMVSFQHHDKQLAELVSEILNKYPNIQKGINWTPQSGGTAVYPDTARYNAYHASAALFMPHFYEHIHGETALYVASALGMPHVVYVLLKQGEYLNTYVPAVSAWITYKGGAQKKAYHYGFIPLQVFDRAKANGHMSEFAKGVREMLKEYTLAVTECGVGGHRFSLPAKAILTVLSLGLTSVVRAKNGVGYYCMYSASFHKYYRTPGYDGNKKLFRQDYFYMNIQWIGNNKSTRNPENTIKGGKYAQYRTKGSPIDFFYKN